MLWGLVALLLVRGLADLLRAEPAAAPPARAAADARAAAPAWPDTEAEAFAADFARSYLSYSPRRPGRYERGLRAFAAPALVAELAPRFARRDSRQVVQAATVVRTARLDRAHAQVTVAARLATARGTATRLLSVPVARDARGALGVYDLPSFAPSTPRALVAPPETQAVGGDAGPAIAGVLERFFPAFLGGRTADLEYLVQAGARLAALDAGLEFVALDDLAQVGAGDGARRTVLATVRVRDVATRAVYGLRYRVALQRSDRWYVASIDVD